MNFHNNILFAPKKQNSISYSSTVKIREKITVSFRHFHTALAAGYITPSFPQFRPHGTHSIYTVQLRGTLQGYSCSRGERGEKVTPHKTPQKLEKNTKIATPEIGLTDLSWLSSRHSDVYPVNFTCYFLEPA